MTKNKKNYNDTSLESLKGPDQVRKRPGVIFGSDGIEGCQHSIFEILSNSIDEAREGHGNEITITYFLDGSIEIADHGRGIPIDFNSREQKYNWELAFCTLYAGGKYNNNSGGNYTFALGLNGLGLCATQFSSEYMEVMSDNGKHKYTLSFKKGYNVTSSEKGFIRGKSSGKSGTVIRWKPDLDVFTDILITKDWFDEVIRRQAIVNDNLTFTLRIEEPSGNFHTKNYCYKNGIDDFLTETLNSVTENDNPALSSPIFDTTEKTGRDRADKEDYKVKLRCAFAFSNKVSFIEHYHNSSWLEHGGSPDKALRSAFLTRFNEYIKQSGKYTKGESTITFSDIEDCLIFISSNFSTQTSYENQTKKSVTNKFIYEAMNDWLRHTLEVWFMEKKTEADVVVSQILANKRARENAEKTRLNLKKKLSGGTDLINRVQKFVDCRSKDISEREIYIVEGDSALGAVKLARNAEFQAVIPVRGKILNCLKAGYDKILSSEIITDLIRVLGCGIDMTGHTGKTHKVFKELSAFNLDNFRFNKIVICTDADVDGYQIRTLILTMLYRLTPKLIEEGFVYIAESPLYEINSGKKTYFAYTEQEKTAILSKLEKTDKKYTIQRSKGLGENEPEMMSLTTMNPSTRRLIKVLPEEAAFTSEVFDILLGDNLQGRKDYILEFGVDYLEAIDVS